tara:strand:+ start:9982 stop:10671 length:690 start_codon:yes stop_codon:yes gene_type:complete
MVGTLKVDRIQKVNSDSDSLTFHDNGITLNKPLTDASGNTILAVDGASASVSGSVLQIAARQHYNGGSHYSVTSNQSLASGQTYPSNGGVDITVKSATSVNMVDVWSGMAYGAAGVLIWNLQHSTDSGSSWSNTCATDTYSSNSNGNPTTDTTTSLMGSQGHSPSYGWAYDSGTWGPRFLRYFHDHNQTEGTTIQYRVVGYNSSAVSNYILHANYMVMSFTVTEIGEIG